MKPNEFSNKVLELVQNYENTIFFFLDIINLIKEDTQEETREKEIRDRITYLLGPKGALSLIPLSIFEQLVMNHIEKWKVFKKDMGDDLKNIWENIGSQEVKNNVDLLYEFLAKHLGRLKPVPKIVFFGLSLFKTTTHYRIMSSLNKNPMTTENIQKTTHLGNDFVFHSLNIMREEKLVQKATDFDVYLLTEEGIELLKPFEEGTNHV